MSARLTRVIGHRHRVIALSMTLLVGCGTQPSPVAAPPVDPSATPAPPSPSLAPSEPPFVPPAPPMPTLTPTPVPSVQVGRSGGSGGGAPAPPPSPATSPTLLAAPIQPFFVGAGEQVGFRVETGQALIAAVSALSYQPTSPAFALSLDATGLGYKVQSAPAPGSAAPPIAWPFRPVPPLPTRPHADRRVLQAAPSPPRELGELETFLILSTDAPDDPPAEQTAALRRISEHAYYYVDIEGLQLSAAQLDEMVVTFESRIHPRLSEAFGEVAAPGVDGDDRLFLVFSPAVHDFGRNTGVLGYFSPHDALPAALSVPESNQKEVLFISDLVFRADPLVRYGVIAHELQHLINFSQKGARLNYRSKEALWLDEGLSMYAMDVAGFGLADGMTSTALDIRSFQERPHAYSLTEWRTNPNGYAYGEAYLFVRYLVDRYGEGIVSEILGSEGTGLAGLDALLRQRQDDVVRFFQAWTTANLVSGTAIAEGTPYNYASIDIRGTYGGVLLPGITPTPVVEPTLSEPLRPWGSAYYAWRSSDVASWFFRLSTGDRTPLSGSLIVP